MTKTPATIPNPEAISTAPDNCIDSGAWYITSFRPKVLREIDNDPVKISTTQTEADIEKEVIKKIAKNINSAKTGLADRVTYTKMKKEILL
jgi:hypothetical protein